MERFENLGFKNPYTQQFLVTFVAVLIALQYLRVEIYNSLGIACGAAGIAIAERLLIDFIEIKTEEKKLGMKK